MGATITATATMSMTSNVVRATPNTNHGRMAAWSVGRSEPHFRLSQCPATLTT
jgi:hypothetical protein